MMNGALVSNPSEKNDESNTISNLPSGEPLNMADIHAAMMEELGIGRKDALPLEDRRNPNFLDTNHYPENIKPKCFMPGVSAWRNVVFSDVNPAEGDIDSIADGQLARIRRRGFTNRSENVIADKRENITHAQNQKDRIVISGNVLPTNKVSKKPTSNVVALNIPESSAKKSPAVSVDKNLNPPNGNINVKKKNFHKNSVDYSIARLRAAVPPAKKPPVSTQHQKPAVKHPIRYSRKPDTTRTRRVSRKTSHIERAPVSNSAWGSLDEEAFLAYAIRPTPPGSAIVQSESNAPESVSSMPIKPSSSSDKSSHVGEPSSPDSKFIKPITREDSLFSTSEEASIDKLESSYSSKLECNSENHAPEISIPENVPKDSVYQQAQPRNTLLSESNWAKADPTQRSTPRSIPAQTVRSYALCDVIRAARVKIQKDSGIGQQGLARLLNQENSIHPLLELEINGELIVQQLLDDQTTFNTDPVNPRLMIIFRAVKKSYLDPTWRIRFEFSYIKNNFLQSFNDHRDRMLQKMSWKHGTYIPKDEEYQKPPTPINFSANSPISPHSISASDTVLTEPQESDENLICFGSSNIDEEKSKKPPSLAKFDRINAETFRDLSEIEGIAPSLSDSESMAARTPHEAPNQSTKEEVNVYDDFLLETLYEDTLIKPEGAVLNYLSSILIRQQGTLASMNHEELLESTYFIHKLRIFVTKSLQKSKVFAQLPPHIADRYILNKTYKLIEKRLVERGKPGSGLSGALSLALDLVTLQFKRACELRTDYTSIEGQIKNNSSYSFHNTQQDNGQNFTSPSIAENLDEWGNSSFAPVRQVSEDVQEYYTPELSATTSCDLIDPNHLWALPLICTEDQQIDDAHEKCSTQELQQKRGGSDDFPHISKTRITYSTEELLSLKTEWISPRKECLVSETWKLVATKHASQKNSNNEDRRANIIKPKNAVPSRNFEPTSSRKNDEQLVRIKSSSTFMSSNNISPSVPNCESHKLDSPFVQNLKSSNEHNMTKHYSSAPQKQNHVNIVSKKSNNTLERGEIHQSPFAANFMNSPSYTTRPIKAQMSIDYVQKTSPLSSPGLDSPNDVFFEVPSSQETVPKIETNQGIYPLVCMAE